MLVEMGVAVPSGPVDVLVCMLMAMGVLVVIFHLSLFPCTSSVRYSALRASVV
jgi:hypothetical protein